MSANASFVVPATTAKYVFGFGNSNTTIQSSGPSALSFSQQSKTLIDGSGKDIVNSGTSLSGLGVTASAWNLTKSGSSYTLSQSTLGQYVGGLGITSGENDNLPTVNTGYNGSPITTPDQCVVGGCGTHQIDSQGNSIGSISTDVIQLVFDRAVVLGSVGRNSYGLVSGASYLNNGKTYNDYLFDNDFSFGNGTGSGLSGTSMTQTQFDSMWDAYRGSSGQCALTTIAGNSYGCNENTDAYSQTQASTAGLASKVWYISAGAALASFSGADSIADAFKLNDLSVYVYTAQSTVVPEPATWAMMVIGFGMTGTAIRRRRAADRKAATAV